MTTVVPTPFPHPGDPTYVDHSAIALARLPQQFKQERQNPPTRPEVIASAVAGITLDQDSAVFVVNVPVLPEALEGDCVLLMICSSATDHIPDTSLIPPGWNILTQLFTSSGSFVATVMSHVLDEYETEPTQIFLQAANQPVQAGVVVYRYLDPANPLISSSIVDAGNFPVSPPTTFHCPSQVIPTISDIYLGVIWFTFSNIPVTFPSQSSPRILSSNIGTLATFDEVEIEGSSGVQDAIVNVGVLGLAASLALRFYLPEFDSLNNIGRLVSAVCRPVQSLWDTMQQVLLQRALNTAIGAQLDVIGKIVGRPRDGLDDDTYRRYCRATIAAHRSKGTVDELISIAELVVFDPDLLTVVLPYSPAAVIVQLTDIGVTDALANVVYLFLRQAAAAGVALVLQYGNTNPVFRLDQSPSLDQGHLAGEISG